ncbi:hypothetical protein P8452_33421 [Trifolium repens]|nr:hypothetical protein P8452_33419 [Trifolium repens]WJX46641.1 hypothetical protein P8452_33421 [Trifolium repens]
MRNCKDEKCVHLRAKLASIKGKDDIWSVQRGKTEQWLQSFDQRLRESIDYAICLDSIGSWENEPWIHVSKPPENAFIKQIMEDFSSVAEDLGIQVNLKHKKINISNSRENFVKLCSQHESTLQHYESGDNGVLSQACRL